MSLLKFKKNLLNQLVVEASRIIPGNFKMHVVKQPTNRFTVTTPLTHLVIWDANDRNCAICSTPALRKRTKFKCKSCDVYLHPKDCFAKFHS